jgi:alpha-methylacyl-CoA racemase
MILADLGADVVRVERPSGALDLTGGPSDHLLRNRRPVTANLKTPEGLELVHRLIRKADVVLEGFRPGVAERLGVGPEDCTASNPGLVYGRMTGWGQSGPLAHEAGHDINYISVTGILHAIGHEGDRPVPPLNLVGDFGGGSMFLLAGVLSALWERSRSGRGQVIDAAMVDGASALAQIVWAMRGQGVWSDQRASNMLDGAAPFYDTYTCQDGRFVAVGALEPQFYQALLAGLGLDAAELPEQLDQSGWPVLRAKFTAAFVSRPRDEWVKVFEGTDACVTPVLSFEEAAEHPHMAARQTLIEVDGVVQAAPAPRFSRTTTDAPRTPAQPEPGNDTVLESWQA